jgi:hypothetical protein
VLTWLGWSMISVRSVAAGAEHAMALLIVTCPCALGLATPLAVTNNAFLYCLIARRVAPARSTCCSRAR